MTRRAHSAAVSQGRGLYPGLYQQWPGAESNCRHADFQSAALPTELPGRAMQQKNLAGFEGRWQWECLPLFAFCLPLAAPRTAWLQPGRDPLRQ